MNICFFILFFLVWIGLAFNSLIDMSIVFFFIGPVFSYYFVYKLNLLPKKNYFNIKFFAYCLWLYKEMLLSALKVIRLSLQKNISIIPVIEDIEFSQDSNAAIIIYANSITLTPGTVTLSNKGNVMTVHALDVYFMKDLKESILDKKVKMIMKKENA